MLFVLYYLSLIFYRTVLGFSFSIPQVLFIVEQIEKEFRAFFYEGMRLKITPHDPFGPLRREYKIEKAGFKIPLCHLLIWNIDFPKGLESSSEILYFSPRYGKWFFYNKHNRQRSGSYMVEIVGHRYLKYKRLFKKFNISISGDDIRRMLMKKNIRLQCSLETGEEFSGQTLVGDNFFHSREIQIEPIIFKGHELRLIVQELIYRYPAMFSATEFEMVRTYLSYYDM